MDVQRLAELLSDRPATVRVRQAEIVAVAGDGTVSVALPGAGTTLPGVPCMAHVEPVVGRSAWLLDLGGEMVVFGIT
jgi:hypothetical protein